MCRAMIILMLAVCVTALLVPDQPYKIWPISARTGLHFEKIGRIQFYQNEWTLVTFVSFGIMEFDAIDLGLQRLETVCNSPKLSYNNFLFNFTICTNDLRMLKINFKEITTSEHIRAAGRTAIRDFTANFFTTGLPAVAAACRRSDWTFW